MGLLLAGLGLLGSILQGVGASKQLEEAGEQAVAQAKHQARQYKRTAHFQAKDILRQAEVSAKNFLTQAAIHARQAELVRIKGSYDAARMTERGKSIIGGAVASYASTGIALTGSIAEVVHSTGESIAMDIAAARLGTRISWENEKILKKINQKNAKDALKYGKEAAKDTLKFGQEAAKDTMKFGQAAAASANQARPLAFLSPVIAGVGNFVSSSGVFARG